LNLAPPFHEAFEVARVSIKFHASYDYMANVMIHLELLLVEESLLVFLELLIHQQLKRVSIYL